MISDEAVEAAAKAAYAKDNPSQGFWEPATGGMAAKYLSLAHAALKTGTDRSQS